MEQLLHTQTIIIQLLLIVSLVAIVVRRWSIPYTVILVLVGLFISIQRPFEFHLTWRRSGLPTDDRLLLGP